MHTPFADDLTHIDAVLAETLAEAARFLAQIEARPAGVCAPRLEAAQLPEDGLGALGSLEEFKTRFAPWLSGSAGPRYYGLVTGGVTPAALAGDWLVSVYDQNTVGSDESIAPQIELETIGLLRQLFGLPDEFSGAFVTGATMANFVGLALGRQWAGHQAGVDCAVQGLWGLEPLRVFSACPHSSVYKALAMLGMGRGALTLTPCLPGREAADVGGLEEHLRRQEGRPCLVVANAGTVNTVDFDDLRAVAELRARYPFWLHVDAAFGGFAACSPRNAPLVQGMEAADSITIDAHKFLNVPYDAAMQFTRRPDLQAEIFQNAAAYLDAEVRADQYIHLTPENSRRLRALPSWFTLTAYGKQGYAEMVERLCALAQWLGEQIQGAREFHLLAPVRLNGVCFALADGAGCVPMEGVRRYLRRLQADGGVYLTPTVYAGVPAVRASLTNWRITQKDVEQAWEAMLRGAQR